MKISNVDYIVDNLANLKINYDECEGDLEEIWWEDENGNDLVEGIGCQCGMKCLNEERGVGYKEAGWDGNCRECKAKWLMQEYE
jgi:hypothetical protein